MKRLLRSVIQVDNQVTQENLVHNFQVLRNSRVEWDRDDDIKLYKFIQTYFEQSFEMPSVHTLRDYYESQDDTEILERIKDVMAAPWYIQTNFKALVKGIVDNQNKVKAVALIKETEHIITRGLVFKEGREQTKKEGVRDGLIHFAQKANELIIPDFNARIRGEIRHDGQEVWNDYQTSKVNKDKVWGKFCGIEAIDDCCRGIKKGELWIHAAFTGELKTTFALNWAYNLITRYRTNVFYASLEMKYEHLRRILYVIHSANKMWLAQGYQPLDYRRVRDGELEQHEERFYQNVIDDFCNNQSYAHCEVWAPDHDVNIDEVKLEAELLHREKEIGLVCIDHGGLMEARKKKQNKDYVIELNSVLRDTKKFALHFAQGEGMATLLLFQINRTGKTEADKNEGHYKLNALSYANEAERSADVITTTYLNEDDHRKNNTTLFCNLKNRDNPFFEPFRARVNFGNRRIENLEDISSSATGTRGHIEDVNLFL